MNVLAIAPRTTSTTRAERHRLKRADALAARLAELHTIRAVLQDAGALVGCGWVQGAWFTVDDAGRSRAVTAYDLDRVVGREVTGACLVGAVVHAAGGPTEVRSQPVQRSLDLTWHTLREDPNRPVHWCPGPGVRMMHVLELTFWNDAPGRTAEEVAGLLGRAVHTADVQADLCRAEQAVLARS